MCLGEWKQRSHGPSLQLAAEERGTDAAPVPEAAGARGAGETWPGLLSTIKREGGGFSVNPKAPDTEATGLKLPQQPKADLEVTSFF